MAAIPGYDTKERHTHAALAAALAAAYQRLYTHLPDAVAISTAFTA